MILSDLRVYWLSFLIALSFSGNPFRTLPRPHFRLKMELMSFLHDVSRSLSCVFLSSENGSVISHMVIERDGC